MEHPDPSLASCLCPSLCPPPLARLDGVTEDLHWPCGRVRSLLERRQAWAAELMRLAVGLLQGGAQEEVATGAFGGCSFQASLFP